ncbi:MFS transporter, partial [Caballeronia sp.]|uniref:MFS transporter n=1 Tax=Caballeronia sp. TaxID=1931223 RepID=UPI003C5B809E
WVLAAFAGGNALAVVPSGYLSDRMGRRTLLIVGLAASGVATVWLGLVSSLPAFTVAAFVSGATTGIFMSPLQAAVADILGSEARAGLPVAAVQMVTDLGAIVGSMTVGWVVAPETRPASEPTSEMLPTAADVELA